MSKPYPTRFSDADYELIQWAAEKSGAKSMAEFVRTAAVDRARAVMGGAKVDASPADVLADINSLTFVTARMVGGLVRALGHPNIVDQAKKDLAGRRNGGNR